MREREVLSLQKLSVSFFKGTPNETPILRKVDLAVKQGEFVTLVGGNGAGKSTLLNSIAGNVKMDSGRIFLDGHEISKWKEEKRAGLIGRVFQDPLSGTAPRMTLSENLSIALRRGKRRGLKAGTGKKEQEEFKQQLETFELGLENRLDSEVGLLSGGQRQAVALLMATINRPNLLLLDEHTAALDPKTARSVMQLTEERIKEENLTALMITHNMTDALQYGNRLIMLHQGQIVADFSKEEKAGLTVKDLLELFESYSLKE